MNWQKDYDSLYIAHGNSPDAKEMLDNGYIDNLNGLYYDGTLFKRASFRKAPHNSYITYDNILKGANQKGYEMEQEPAFTALFNRGRSERTYRENKQIKFRSPITIKYSTQV